MEEVLDMCLFYSYMMLVLVSIFIENNWENIVANVRIYYDNWLTECWSLTGPMICQQQIWMPGNLGV